MSKRASHLSLKYIKSINRIKEIMDNYANGTFNTSIGELYYLLDRLKPEDYALYGKSLCHLLADIAQHNRFKDDEDDHNYVYMQVKQPHTKDSFQKIYHKKLKRLELQESRSPHSKSKSSPKSRRTHQKNLNEFYFENDNDSYSDDNYDDIYKYVKKESNRDPNKGYPLFPGKDGHKKRGINEKEGNFSKRKRSNQFNEDFDLNMQSDDERNVNFRKRSNKNTKHLDLNNQSFDGKTNFKKGSNHRNNKFDLYNQSFDDDNIHSRKDFNQLNGRFDLNNQSFDGNQNFKKGSNHRNNKFNLAHQRFDDENIHSRKDSNQLNGRFDLNNQSFNGNLNGKTRSNPYSENFDPNNNSNAWNDGYDRNDKLIKKKKSKCGCKNSFKSENLDPQMDWDNWKNIRDSHPTYKKDLINCLNNRYRTMCIDEMNKDYYPRFPRWIPTWRPYQNYNDFDYDPED